MHDKLSVAFSNSFSRARKRATLFSDQRREICDEMPPLFEIEMNTWVALSEIARNVGLALAAVVGAVLAWRQLSPAASQARSARAQAELARRAHVMDLFNRAAGQLRDPKLEVRLAAIFLLRGVARDFPDFADPIFELLQACLRDAYVMLITAMVARQSTSRR